MGANRIVIGVAAVIIGWGIWGFSTLQLGGSDPVVSAVSSTIPDAPVTVAAPAAPRADGVVPASELAFRPAPLGVGSVASATSRSVPVRVEIPSIDVDTDLESLGLAEDGSLAAPVDFAKAGWFASGVEPGQRGPSVIAGHVDSVTGPAVFFRLRDLGPGDEIFVTRADGQRLRFVVGSSQAFAKDAFPSDLVYGPTTTAALRVVTCTGDFDRGAHSYTDNLVVFAELASG